jgi:hypothetical protein
MENVETIADPWAQFQRDFGNITAYHDRELMGAGAALARLLSNTHPALSLEEIGSIIMTVGVLHGTHGSRHTFVQCVMHVREQVLSRRPQTR